jgi:hypothetical protein
VGIILAALIERALLADSSVKVSTVTNVRNYNIYNMNEWPGRSTTSLIISIGARSPFSSRSMRGLLPAPLPPLFFESAILAIPN